MPIKFDDTQTLSVITAVSCAIDDIRINSLIDNTQTAMVVTFVYFDAEGKAVKRVEIPLEPDEFLPVIMRHLALYADFKQSTYAEYQALGKVPAGSIL